MWQLFAQSSIGDRSIIQSRSLSRINHIEQAVYLSHSASCAWMTTVQITARALDPTDLTHLAKLPNLRNFHMATSHETPADVGFNDRVLRSWAEAAANHGAFAHLKTIFLYFQEGATRWSLDHLSAFPALDEFCAYRCKLRRHHASNLFGWDENPQYVDTERELPWHLTVPAMLTKTFYHSATVSWASSAPPNTFSTPPTRPAAISPPGTASLQTI